MNNQTNNFQSMENLLNYNQNSKIMTEEILNSHFLKELSNFNLKNGNNFNNEGNGGLENYKNENNGITMNTTVNNNETNYNANNYNCLNQLNNLTQSLFNDCNNEESKFKNFNFNNSNNSPGLNDMNNLKNSNNLNKKSNHLELKEEQKNTKIEKFELNPINNTFNIPNELKQEHEYRFINKSKKSLKKENDKKEIKEYYDNFKNESEHEKINDLKINNCPLMSSKEWDKVDDNKLYALVNKYGDRNWDFISKFFDSSKSPVKCFKRWNILVKPKTVKGPWNIEEDKKLIDWIKNNGPCNWTSCASLIPGRTGKQCRERWANSLNPLLKKGLWEPEEDYIIFKLFKLIGSKWAMISNYLCGRTENSTKNRFYSTLRRYAGENIKKIHDKTKLNFNNLIEYFPLAYKDKTKDIDILIRKSSLSENEALNIQTLREILRENNICNNGLLLLYDKLSENPDNENCIIFDDKKQDQEECKKEGLLNNNFNDSLDENLYETIQKAVESIDDEISDFKINDKNEIKDSPDFNLTNNKYNLSNLIDNSNKNNDNNIKKEQTAINNVVDKENKNSAELNKVEKLNYKLLKALKKTNLNEDNISQENEKNSKAKYMKYFMLNQKRLNILNPDNENFKNIKSVINYYNNNYNLDFNVNQFDFVPLSENEKIENLKKNLAPKIESNTSKLTSILNTTNTNSDLNERDLIKAKSNNNNNIKNNNSLDDLTKKIENFCNMTNDLDLNDNIPNKANSTCEETNETKGDNNHNSLKLDIFKNFKNTLNFTSSMQDANEPIIIKQEEENAVESDGKHISKMSNLFNQLNDLEELLKLTKSEINKINV